MTAERPLVVLAGPINADGHANLEREARVVLCNDETELFNLDNVVCSSHVAGVTREASRQASLQVSGEMLRVLRGEMPDVLVNPEVGPRLGLR